MDQISTAIAAASGRFKVFVPLLTASVGADDKKHLTGIASSTVKDLHGDRMTENAIAEMERSAKNNMTIFLNHSYEVPEDVAGSVTDARVTRSADGEIVDLHFDIVIDEENPRATKAWNSIQRGTKLGLSIGAMIPEGGATWDAGQGGYIINHIDLLETSLVGVPANPRSWVEYAVKSLPGLNKAAAPVQVGSPAVTLDAVTGEYVIRGQLGDVAVVRNGESDTTVAASPAPAEPAPGETEEPEKQASSITVIQIDTGNDDSGSSGDDDSSQGAPESDPENGATGVTAKDTTTADATLGLSPEGLNVLNATNELVLSLSKALETAEAERDAAIARAEETERAAAEMLQRTSTLLERVKDIPLGRKAVVTEVVDEFQRSMSDVYAPGALKILDQANVATK